MEDVNVSDRLKKRFQVFGQFFKGFFSPEADVAPTIHSDKIYDDTRKYQERKVLEFQKPSPTDQQKHSTFRDQYAGHGHFSTDLDLPKMFGQTRNIFEEFEQAMKIFDDFAFILQHPNLGFETVNFQDEDDEQEGRYFKFFGKSGELPHSSSINENPSGTAPVKPEENFRDLMLKADSNENRVGVPSKSSLLSSVLDSSWWHSDSGKSSMDRPTASHNQSLPYGSYGSSSYFQFISEETSLKTNGMNVRVNATKIRETPEGREVITYNTNEEGVTEEVREFIPRKDFANSPTSSPNSIIAGFFRPRL